MSQTHRNTAFSPRREATVPARSVAKAPPSRACPSCGREAGCNCHARDADAQDALDMAEQRLERRLERLEAAERHTRDLSCTVCGRDSGCGCRSITRDDPLITMCLDCGEVSDETCRCTETPAERMARVADENHGMTEVE